METCNHKTVKAGMVTKEFLGELFKTKGLACSDCGAELWDDKIQRQFDAWLIRLHATKRDKFTVQFSLTDKASVCLKKLVEKFPGSTETMILRALTAIYLDRVATDPSNSTHIERITQGDVFQDLASGPRKNRCKVTFKPLAMLDLQSFARIVEVSPSKLIEEAILRVFSVYIEIDPVMKEFWESTFLPELKLILKAA